MIFKIVLFLLIQISWANDSLYLKREVGEKDIDNYYGPSFPKISKSPYDHYLFFDEFGLNEDSFEFITSHQFSVLKNFIEQEVDQSIECPSYFLNQHFDYIRYLYRLVSISYLYEAINNYQVNLGLLGKLNSCKVDWKQTFASCRAKSADMKKFIKNLERANQYYNSSLKELRPNQKFVDTWFENFYQGIETTVGHARLYGKCAFESKNCTNLKKEEVLTYLENSCSEDLNLLKNLCSEEDELYGMSYVPEAIELIFQSNAKTIFNTLNSARGCLSRFTQSMENREREHYQLSDIFAHIYEQLANKHGASYVQGKIFVQGALKEFELKGLPDIYEEVIVKSVIEVPKIVEEKKNIPDIIVAQDAKIIIQNPDVKKVEQVVKKEEVVLEKISKTAFLEAVEFLELNKLSTTEVDMNKFKFDYVFTFSTLKKLQQTLKSYITRKALKEMSEMDNLGKSSAPVPLIFLKYLIDTNNHQGLFNITSVLGERFYVVNTIDQNSQNKPQWIELKNDLSTHHRWQITVLDDSKRPTDNSAI